MTNTIELVGKNGETVRLHDENDSTYVEVFHDSGIQTGTISKPLSEAKQHMLNQGCRETEKNIEEMTSVEIKIEIAKNNREMERVQESVQKCKSELERTVDGDLGMYSLLNAVESISESLKKAVEKSGELTRRHTELKNALKKNEEENKENGKKMIDDLIVRFGSSRKKWERKFDGKECFSRQETAFLQERFNYKRITV